jgi:hypothetical protein
MGIYNKHSRKVRWTVVFLLIVIIMAGCAGITPYEPRNNREEGPQKGLFTGSEGEWVIFRKAEEQEPGSKDQKSADESKDIQSKDDGQSQGSE